MFWDGGEIHNLQRNLYPYSCVPRRREWESIEVEESDDLEEIFSLLTCLHEKPTVMKREADHLLYLWYDVHITQPAQKQQQRIKLSCIILLEHQCVKWWIQSPTNLLASSNGKWSLCGFSTTFCTCEKSMEMKRIQQDADIEHKPGFNLP